MASSQKKRVLQNIIFIPMCIDQQSLLTSLTNSQLKPILPTYSSFKLC